MLPWGSEGVGGLSPFSPFCPLGPFGPMSPVLFPLFLFVHIDHLQIVIEHYIAIIIEIVQVMQRK